MMWECLFLLLVSSSPISTISHRSDGSRRKLARIQSIPEYIFEKGCKIPEDATNSTVFGAMIMSKEISKTLNFVKHSTLRGKDNDSTLSGLSSGQEAAMTRLTHARSMQKKLPFQVAEWPGIFTMRCPQNMHKKNHKTERGVAMAHYQIWHEFAFFDYRVTDAAAKKETSHDLYTQLNSTKVAMPQWADTALQEAATQGRKGWITADGNYAAFYDRETDELMRFKHGVTFRDSDILNIFEDDADIATSRDVGETLFDEYRHFFLTEEVDLLYLGWCEGRLAWPVPLCLHSYAMSRRGARKAVASFEICGLAVDEQLVRMCKNDVLKYDRVRPWSYTPTNKRYPQPKDPTKGMFHQRRMGSFNGHTGFSLSNHESYARKFYSKRRNDGEADNLALEMHGESA